MFVLATQEEQLHFEHLWDRSTMYMVCELLFLKLSWWVFPCTNHERGRGQWFGTSGLRLNHWPESSENRTDVVTNCLPDVKGSKCFVAPGQYLN